MRKTLFIALLSMVSSICIAQFNINGLKPGMTVATFKKAAVNAGFVKTDMKSPGTDVVFFEGNFRGEKVKMAASPSNDTIKTFCVYVNVKTFDQAIDIYEKWSMHAIEEYKNVERYVAPDAPEINLYDKKTSTALCVQMIKDGETYRVLYSIAGK